MLILYHNFPSVCCHKVRYCLAEKGIAYDTRLIDSLKGEQFDPAYMKLNPNAVVPTLVHDGKVMIESSVIVQYLDDVFPEPRLMPEDDHLKALARIWLLRSLDVHGAIATMSYATAYRERELRTKTPEEREANYRSIPDRLRAERKRDLTEKGIKSIHVEAAADVLTRAVRDMDAALGQWEWLSGNDFSLGDIALIAYVDRLYRLGLEGFWADYPRVADWYERMRSRPAYAAGIEAFLDGTPDMRAFGNRAWPEIESLLKAA